MTTIEQTTLNAATQAAMLEARTMSLAISVDPTAIGQLKDTLEQLQKAVQIAKHNTLASIATWFTEAVPEPTEKNTAVQLGCHLEEVGEMLTALGMSIPANIVDHWAHTLKTDGVPPATVDRNALLDALCDQIVTSVGVAHMYGLDIQGALAEVNRSNYSKFVDGKPVFDANGKIAKPASYSKPDLSPFLGNEP